MNKERRARITALVAKLQEAHEELELIRDEEQEAFDNLHENFQAGETGEKMQESINTMDEAVSNLDDAITTLENMEN